MADPSPSPSSLTPSCQPLTGLIAPYRYGIVEEKLYRGAYPTLVNFRFLRRLRVRTIISLIPEQPSSDLISFCVHHQINNIYINVEKWNEAVTITNAQVASVVEHLIRPQLHPIYIHCLDGGNITGLVIMALRKLQCWTIPSIISEHQRYTRDHSIDSSEKAFIKNFAHDIHVPETGLPKWLWQGRRLARHKLININPLPSDSHTTDSSSDTTTTQPPDSFDKLDKKKSTPMITTTTAEQQQWEEMLGLYRWGMNRTHVFYDALLCSQDQDQLYYEDSDEDEFLEPEYSDDLQALALEGCTMNPEWPRPLQMFHSTNDPI